MEPTGQDAPKSRGIVTAVAAVWAVLVGGLMAGAATYFDVAGSDVLAIGVLGGMGAAAAVYVFAARQ